MVPGCCSHAHQSGQHFHIYQPEPAKSQRIKMIKIDEQFRIEHNIKLPLVFPMLLSHVAVSDIGY